MSLHNLPNARRQGGWVPTLVGVTNIAAITLVAARYCIVADNVLCYFCVSVDPTTDNVITEWRMSLPVPRNIGAVSDIIGNCGPQDGSGYGGSCSGNVANDQVFCGTAFGTGNITNAYGHLSYLA